MKTRNWRGRLRVCLTCLLLICALLPGTALARGLIDLDEPTSLTIKYPCAGATFRIYRVADVSETGVYTLTGDFEDYPVSLRLSSQSAWRRLAETLAIYVDLDGLRPLDSGKTKSRGRLTFSDLEAGLYLVTGRECTEDGYVYTPEPFLVALPGLDADDAWTPDVTASPKYDKDRDEPDVEPVKRKALKIWEDDDPDERPAKITVHLLRDGKVWDTVTLSEKNNWSYTWEELDGNYTWQVVEANVPDGYTVTVSREGVTFVITNTHTTDIPEPPTPGGPSEPPIDIPSEPPIDIPPEPPVDISDEPTPWSPATPDTPQPSTPDVPSPTLPQTGVLWWPVPLLACSGVGLFLSGWLRRRSEDNDDA